MFPRVAIVYLLYFEEKNDISGNDTRWKLYKIPFRGEFTRSVDVNSTIDHPQFTPVSHLRSDKNHPIVAGEPPCLDFT